MKDRPTSKDVAKLAGVSRTTVSYVINNKSGGNVRISDETRQKVWDAVKTLHYNPVSAAQTLRTKRSNLLAVMIPRVENPFYPHFAAAAQYEAEKENFDVIIYSTHNELERERDFINVLLRRGVDGVITQTYQLSSEDIDQLVKAGIGVVVHGSNPTHPHVDNIMLDEVKAVEEVVTYLIDKGHQRIGTLAGPQTTWGGRLRQEGYERALRTHGLPVEEELVIETRFRRGYGARAMGQLLALPEPPTAIFAANDLLAVDALLHVIDSGLSVPDDIAIVGFDNIPESTIVRPRLTTVHKDVNLLARTAIKMLLERISSEETLEARQTLVDYDIIYRESA